MLFHRVLAVGNAREDAGYEREKHTTGRLTRGGLFVLN